MPEPLFNLRTLLDRRGLTQREVGAYMEMSETKMSRILKGHLEAPEGFENAFMLAVEEAAAEKTRRLLGKPTGAALAHEAVTA